MTIGWVGIERSEVFVFFFDWETPEARRKVEHAQEERISRTLSGGKSINSFCRQRHVRKSHRVFRLSQR
eukprot:scaffold25081_cov157-Isochrysis_galbana.AAC.2